jgi:dTDP-4-dehydrorhamnose 3,5-epimerase
VLNSEGIGRITETGGEAMEFEPMDGLPEVILVTPDARSDESGRRVELYNQDKYEEGGVAWQFAQASIASSRRGVLRGLHYQHPRGQGVLLSVTRGEAWCVAVDVRVGSPTYGTWRGARLSAESGQQLWLPSTYAHGWLVLSEEADVVSQCTDMDDPTSHRTLLWNDASLGIEWPGVAAGATPCVSAEDAAGRALAALASSNELPIFIG